MDRCVYSQYRLASRRALEFLRFQLELDGALLLLREDNQFRIESIAGLLPGLVEDQTFALENSPFSLVISNAVPVIAPDVRVTSYDFSSLSLEFYPAAVVTTCVYDSSGELHGLIIGMDTKVRASKFCENERVLDFCAQQIELAVEQCRLVADYTDLIESLSEQAYIDSMTNLLNRNGWDSAFASIATRGFIGAEFASVFLFDVDGLKAINDTQGHAAGDEAIRLVAEVLKNEIVTKSSPHPDSDVVGTDQREHLRLLESEGAIVARTGGDEFSAILLGCDDLAATRTKNSISTKLAEKGVSVSVGYACCRNSRRLPDALVNADDAMYQNKAARKKQQNIKVASGL